MEAGMMAVYTIYATPARPCPLAFVGGDFWTDPEQATLAVRNISGKPISSFTLMSEMLLSQQDLRRPFNAEWTRLKPLEAGEKQTLSKPGIPAASAHNVLGWVFFPNSIQFADGAIWQPDSEGECFGVIWRDAQHPAMPVLPPRQIEMNPD